ncbi:DMT family transporter [Desulfococcus sp.]|uniref:DMT family transporter n=1 Tax=Desulfococcus sp. TaxID=2025834 RepID=UPI003592F412
MPFDAKPVDMPLPAILYTIFLCALFGGNTVAIKISLSGMGPFTNAGLRFAVAGAAIIVWAAATGRPFRLKKGQAGHILATSMIFTAQLALFYLGMARTNASRGALMSNLVPFFVLILAHFVIPGDRFTVRKCLGILLGFGGVAFLFSDQAGISADLRTGDLIILGAVVLWSVNSVYVKRIIHRFETFHLVLYPMVFAVPIFLAAGGVADGPMTLPPAGDVLAAMAYQALVTASYGFLAWNTLLRKYGAVAMHSFIFVMPPVGVALGAWMLDEPVTPRMLIALAMITAGILVVHVRPKKPAPVLTAGP